MKSLRAVARRMVDRVTRGSVVRTLSETDGPFNQINHRIEHIQNWVGQINQRVEHTHSWVGQISPRVGHTESWVGQINQRVEHTYDWVTQINRRVDRLEAASIGRDQMYAHAPALGDRTRGVLSLLSPRNPVGHSLRRFGRDHDGGYMLLDDILASDGIAYSFGIADDVSWDLELAERGYQVFQYDHTIEALPTDHHNFQFHRLGICASSQSVPQMLPLDQIIEQNGHAGKRNMILKIDIEGLEWSILSAMPAHTLKQFDQIVIEYHMLDRLYEDSFYEVARQALTNIRKLFVPVHVHGNNYHDIKILGGVPVPQLLEVTYVRDGLIETAPCDRTFPTGLDQPNRPDRPDLFLGSFQFSRTIRDMPGSQYVNEQARREPGIAAVG